MDSLIEALAVSLWVPSLIVAAITSVALLNRTLQITRDEKSMRACVHELNDLERRAVALIPISYLSTPSRSLGEAFPPDPLARLLDLEATLRSDPDPSMDVLIDRSAVIDSADRYRHVQHRLGQLPAHLLWSRDRQAARTLLARAVPRRGPDWVDVE